MRHTLRWLGGIIAALILLPLAAVFGALLWLNTAPGHDYLAGVVGRISGGELVVRGVSGRLPVAPHLQTLELRDANGTWAIIHDLTLNWSPLQLLHRDVKVDRVTAARIEALRMPVQQATASDKPASWHGFRVDIDALGVARVDLAGPVAGHPASLAVSGSAHLISPTEGDARLAATRLDASGTYAAKAEFGPSRISAELSAEEAAQGLISMAANLPNLGALDMHATLDGPPSAPTMKLRATAGELRAAGQGSVDLDHEALDVDLAASAPAMAPRPDLSWQSVGLDAHVHGPYAKLNASAKLRIEGLAASGAAIRVLSASVQGSSGRLDLTATAESVRIPGPNPDLLAAAPVAASATMRLDAPGRPLTFTLAHPLIQASGSADTTSLHGRVTLGLPELRPLAAAANLDLQGRAALNLTFAMAGAGRTQVDIDGTLAVSGGLPQAVALIGDSARVGISGEAGHSDVTIARLLLNGRAIDVFASGRIAPENLHLDWKAELSDLNALAPALTGKARAEGRIDGRQDDLSVLANGSGEIGAKNIRPEPVTFAMRLGGLPGAPAGQVTAEGTLDRAPLAVAVGVSRLPDGTTRLAIDRADWKSAHAEGTLILAPGASLPLGRIALRMTRLDELRPFVGQPVGGSLEAIAELEPNKARVRAEARNAGIAGQTEIRRAALSATIADPTGHPLVDASLAAEGVRAGGIAGNASVEMRGPEERLALKLSGGLAGIGGASARIESAGEVNAKAKELRLASLQASWKSQTLRLLSPARIEFGNAVAIERLHIGLGQAVLEVNGRVQPTLDLQVALRNAPLDLARGFDPKLRAAGSIEADARLFGTLARPNGNARLSVSGLRALTALGQGLPPANLTATAQLDGGSARINARLSAGNLTNFAVSGSAALEPTGPLNLNAVGAVDLAMLNPIVEAQGLRVRGRLNLDAGVVGTLRAPRARGSAQLADGELQDYARGAHLSDIAASLVGDNEVLRIGQFAARAGEGTISGSGSVGVLAPGMPVDVRVAMNNAKPLESNLLTAALDADVSLTGQAQTALQAAGRIHIRRAEINVPDKLPQSVAVLKVRVAGEPPPPPPPPGPTIALNLTLDAPRSIFVRGHGLDAELGGTLQIGGTAKHPRPNGGFQMIRGQFSLAGTTLNFTEGDITFTGGSNIGANRIDPALRFVATTSSNNVSATLTVGGFASDPKLTLSSVPQLPQDEILARLLFGQSVASLSPFQIAQIGSSLAEISGVTSGGLGDPLNRLRTTLGLDRLTIGTNPVNPAVTPGTAGSTNTTVVQAGRYVAPGVYVGAKQSVAGAGQETGATLQVDITKHLKLQTGIGAGLGANNIGLTYQFQY